LPDLPDTFCRKSQYGTSPLNETTKLILSAAHGDGVAVDDLLPIVYDELRAMAARRLQNERTDHTLQPTALVNEAFLRLADQTQVDWQGKAHFCAVAATMMRRVLLDHARKRAAVKRQGDLKRVPFEETLLPDISSKPVDIVMLNDLMARLAELNPRHARVFELRCFGGLNVKETAVVLDVSEATVKNDWRFARAWLASQLGPEQDE
jgi:RNA polymerase sigma-70 factor, ECF subfamily